MEAVLEKPRCGKKVAKEKKRTRCRDLNQQEENILKSEIDVFSTSVSNTVSVKTDRHDTLPVVSQCGSKTPKNVVCNATEVTHGEPANVKKTAEAVTVMTEDESMEQILGKKNLKENYSGGITSDRHQSCEKTNHWKKESVGFHQMLTKENVVNAFSVCDTKICDKKMPLYPNLKHFESDVLVFEPLIRAHIETFKCITSVLANRCYAEFCQDVHSYGEHEFYELLEDFKNARMKFFVDLCNIKDLKLHVKKQREAFWISNEKSVEAEGLCENGHKVKIIHKYNVKELDKDIVQDVNRELNKLEECFLKNLTLHSYIAQVSELKIKLYLCDLKKSIKKHTVKPFNLTEGGFTAANSYVVQKLKICIGVLFHYQRIPTKDEEFLALTRVWLENLVAELLHVGSLNDHLFVLNHVLRCPFGISYWTKGFIQLPSPALWSPNEPEFSVLDSEPHYFCLTAIFLILNHVPDREHFLKDIPSSSANEHMPSDCFVILDSDGEEEIDKYKFVKEWSEDDILSLLDQIPVVDILKHAFAISSEDGSYDAKRTSELNMQKIFALSTFLIDLFLYSLTTYNCLLFTRVAKRIGKIVSVIVKHVSLHWECCKKSEISGNFGLQREFDRFIFHITKALFANEKYGMVETLVSFTFDNVSPKMLWNLLWIFHCSVNCAEDTIYAERDVDSKLKSRDARMLLLNNCNKGCAINILKTMKNLGLSLLAEEEFVCCVVQEIFEVSIDNEEANADYYDEGINLLCSMAANHQYIFSYFLELINLSADKTAKRSIELFRKSNLSKWIPKSEDVVIISDWLLDNSLSSAKNQLSRLILQSLHWDVEGTCLALPADLHRQVGLLIVEAYSKYDGDGNNWRVSKGIDQMLRLYASIRCQHIETDKGFVSWAWELLFSLKLHVMNLPNPPWIKIFDGHYDDDDDNIPDLYEDEGLHNLLRMFQQKQPAACYLVLAMTKIGHSLKHLSKQGLPIISALIEKKQYAASIQCLYLVLPFFVKNHEILITNMSFMQNLTELILADQTTLKSSQSTVIGTVLSKIADMIKIQIFQARKLTIEFASPLIRLWLQILIKILSSECSVTPKAAASQVHCLLDVVVKIAFLHKHTRDGLLEIMFQITGPLICSPVHRKQSFWSGMFRSVKSLSVLLPEPSVSYPWFGWCVLSAETNQKIVQDVWMSVQNKLSLDSEMMPDVAFKKTTCEFPEPFPLTYDDLPIYRWCSQAISTPANHPVLPLLCQNFFLNYLQRTNSSGNQERSTGIRFFQTGTYIFMLKQLVVKLKEAEDFHHQCVNKFKLEGNHATSEEMSSQMQKIHSVHKQMQFHQNLVITYRAFQAWLEDPHLHSPNICFSALEPKYLSEKLKLILENDVRLWSELVNTEMLEEEILPKNDLWNCYTASLNSLSENPWRKESVPFWKSLDSYNMCVLPPPCKEYTSPVISINDQVISSWNLLSQEISFDQNVIFKEAKNFGEKLAQLKNVNERFLKLIPAEYKNIDCEKSETKTCYHSCPGAAKFLIKAQTSVRNCKVQSEIEHNRIDFLRILSEMEKLPTPELCLAAVHMENCVKMLVQSKEAANHKESCRLDEIGVKLFYSQLKVVEKTLSSIGCFAPTKQFFSLCIDVLGKNFVLNRKDQSILLAKNVIESSASAGLASPFFSLTDAQEEDFISVYDTLVNSVMSGSLCSLFALLTKVHLKKWLVERNVSFTCRQELLKKIKFALLNCGPEPDGDLLPVYEVFKKHFGILLLHEFPEHFAECVNILLEGTGSKKMNAELWCDFFKNLGCSFQFEKWNTDEVKTSLKKFALNQSLTPDQKQFVSSPSLQLDQVIESLHVFNQFFLKIRKASSEPLYSMYKSYATPVAIFLGMMSHALLKVNCENLGPCVQKTEQLWRIIYNAFQAWIDPWFIENRMEFPWSLCDESLAKITFQIFAMCIEFHHDYSYDPSCEKGILSYIWNYYVNMYVKPAVRNYSMVVCHSVFVTLPWHKFCPVPDDIEGMCLVLHSNVPECREFLSKIIIKIPWVEVMANMQSMKPPCLVRQALTALAKLVIQTGWEYAVVKMKCHQRMVKKLEKLSWHLITVEDVNLLLHNYCQLASPENLLSCDQSNDVPDLYLLNFLKFVSCMVPMCQMTPPISKASEIQLEEKRVLYLQKYVYLMHQYVEKQMSAPKKIPERFYCVIASLFEEVEVLILKDFLPSEHIIAAVPLVKEILTFINFIEDKKLLENIMKPTMHWIQSNPRTPLLLPSIKIACAFVTNIPALVSVVETCINARYSAELQEPAEAQEIWNLISCYFCIPSDNHDSFIESCVKQNAYLTLYEYVLRRLSSSQKPESKVLLLRRMITWSEKITFESSEAKVVLLWDVILEVAQEVACIDKNLMDAVSCLSVFSKTLALLGEDRMHSGALSVLGFGKPSIFSVNFRFLCRALSAYVFTQIPEGSSLRLEANAAGHVDKLSHTSSFQKKSVKQFSVPHPSNEALKAIEDLKNLTTNRPYLALKSQVEYSLVYIYDSKFCFAESRDFLKEIALRTFPNHSFLHILGHSRKC